MEFISVIPNRFGQFRFNSNEIVSVLADSGMNWLIEVGRDFEPWFGLSTSHDKINFLLQEGDLSYY